MSAKFVSVELTNGVDRFFCPACGTEVFGDEGLSDAFCRHVVAVVNWIDDLQVGPALAPANAAPLARAHEEDGSLAAISAVLSETTVVFELIESARGGGHDGTNIVIAVDFLIESADEQVSS